MLINVMNLFSRFTSDTAGFITSMLCAIHCSVVPVFISLGLLSSKSWLHSHSLDWMVIGLGVVIASYSLVGDYFRKHRNAAPVITALFGFCLLITGMIEHHGWMLVFSVLGGILVAMAHLINHRIGRLVSVRL